MRRRNDPATSAQPSAPPPLPQQPSPTPAARPATDDRSSVAQPPPKQPETPTGFRPPSMPAPYERIVTSVFDMPEPDQEFKKLREELELSKVRPSQASYGVIVDALDVAEINAQRAVELVVNFKLVASTFEEDVLALSGPLRERAKAQLEKEKSEAYEQARKDLGSKAPTGKQITNDDITAAVSSMFPDEARALAHRKTQAKGAVEAAESLAERWKERARDLRAMVSTTRGPGSH